MLFETIRSVAQAPSLAKVLLYIYITVCNFNHFNLQVLVIWNNVHKSPPSGIIVT